MVQKLKLLLVPAKASSNSMSTRSSSLKSMAVPAEVSGEALSGSMPVVSWSPYPRARSNKKVTSHKSTGIVACYPPPFKKKGGRQVQQPQFHQEPLGSQPIFSNKVNSSWIMCWAALAWGIVVIQHPRRFCIDVSGSDLLPHECQETRI